MKEVNIKTFYALDLDRTLLDTVKAADLFRSVVAEHDVVLAETLAQEVEDYSLRGKSFSMRDFIAERAGEPVTAEIEAKFIKVAATHNLLNAGAKELIAFIETLPDADFGILTYGSPSGQMMKIRAAGLASIRHLVTSEAFKGQQISSWRTQDGFYSLPEPLGGGRAATVVLVDDKSFSFQGLASDCRGYWVSPLRGKGEDHPVDTITPVNSLAEVIAFERAMTVRHPFQHVTLN